MEMYHLFYHFFFPWIIQNQIPFIDQTISLSHNSCLLISKMYVVDYQKLVKCSQNSCNSIDIIKLGGEVSNPLLINEGVKSDGSNNASGGSWFSWNLQRWSNDKNLPRIGETSPYPVEVSSNLVRSPPNLVEISLDLY